MHDDEHRQTVGEGVDDEHRRVEGRVVAGTRHQEAEDGAGGGGERQAPQEGDHAHGLGPGLEPTVHQGQQIQADNGEKAIVEDHVEREDGLEVVYGTNPLINDADLDSDGDVLTNIQEITYGTNPYNADTDGDLMPDKWEVTAGLNPLVRDSHADKDADGYTNWQEFTSGTQPDSDFSHPLYAAGCWSMVHYIPSHTGAAPFFGPGSDVYMAWNFSAGSSSYSSPVVGPDGTIYYCTQQDSALRAVNPDGTLKWVRTHFGWWLSSPAIGADGKIYVGAGSLYSYFPDGTLNWSRPLGGDVSMSCPSIGKDGTVYVGNSARQLCAIDYSGNIKWTYYASGLVNSSPAIGPDGTIYVGDNSGYLHAVNPDGTCKWSIQTYHSFGKCSPVVSPDGTIFSTTSDGWFFAINPDGTEKYRVWIDSSYGSPAFGHNGIVYVPGLEWLFAFNPGGTERWRVRISQPTSPVVAVDGTIYVISRISHMAYGINSNGTVLWSIPFDTNLIAESSPALSCSGCIYFTARHGSASSSTLYAIAGKTPVGDINRDGIVDICDVILGLRMAIELPVNLQTGNIRCPYTSDLVSRANLDANPKIDISDAILILRKVLGL